MHGIAKHGNTADTFVQKAACNRSTLCLDAGLGLLLQPPIQPPSCCCSSLCRIRGGLDLGRECGVELLCLLQEGERMPGLRDGSRQEVGQTLSYGHRGGPHVLWVLLGC